MYMQNNPGRVITKYQFSPLFSEAWYKAACPQNLIAGFKKAGVCPFDSNAIKLPPLLPATEDDLTDDLSPASSLTHVVEDGTPVPDSHNDHIFSLDQVELFQRRYDNGYDVYQDADYVHWLIENHFDDVPDDVFAAHCEMAQCNAGTEVVGSKENGTKDACPKSDEDGGCKENDMNDGHPKSDAEVSGSEENGTKDADCASELSSTDLPTADLSPPSSSSDVSRVSRLRLSEKENSHSSSDESRLRLSEKENSHSSLNETSINRTPTSVDSTLSTSRVLSDITQFLVYPKMTSTPKSKMKKKSSGPRVLTSAKAIALMEEKERQKKENQAAKELRKKQREEKRRRSEELKVQKDKERQSRAEERKKREYEKKKKAEERENKKKRKTNELAIKKYYVRSGVTSDGQAENGLQRSEISSNECAVCFGHYDDDFVGGELEKEWLQCTNLESCGKWMHVSCLSANECGQYTCALCKATFT